MYKNQFLLHVLQDDTPYFFSSIVKLNDYYDNVLAVPLVKAQSVDSNHDDKIDTVKIKISFPSTPTSIKNVKLMLFFDYYLTVRQIDYQYRIKLSYRCSLCVILI